METTGVPRFSLVIPAWNEEKYLPRLLDTVDEARRRYSGGAERVEVIVADNGSDDATAAVAASRGCRIARVEKHVIAAVRNGGAAIARGEILCFVDADSRIHPDTFDAVDQALASGRVVGGATGVRVERWSPGIVAAWCMVVPLVWLTRMDTGTVFCRAADFRALGGYDESRLFAEDVDFLWRLRRLGKGRGQRLARLRAKTVASMRKWDAHGDWHYVRMLFSLPLHMARGRGAERFAKKYWYTR